MMKHILVKGVSETGRCSLIQPSNLWYSFV